MNEWCLGGFVLRSFYTNNIDLKNIIKKDQRIEEHESEEEKC